MPTVSTGHHDDSKSLVQPGEILLGKYRVERVLGAGAMGEVVSATHLTLRERVAIKLLRPEAARFDDAHQRFLREARAVVRIKSEHVVRVSDVSVTASGIPAMVMEHLDGSDLQALLRQQGPLSVAVAVDYMLQACEAIAEAHMLGIVHRDIKPANLFLTHRADGSPCIKVLDFGISKVALADPSASDAAMAQTSTLMGTPVYMSPEQLESTAGVDARTDIWSLGVTLYELLTGTWPFSAATLPQLITKILTARAPSVRRARPDVPPNLDGAIGCCLTRDLGLRFANVAELANALAPFGSPLARMSAERISLIVTGARGGSQPVLPAALPTPENRSVEAAQAEGTTVPLAATRAATVVAGAGNTGAGPWGGTLRRKAANSRFVFWAGILAGFALTGLVILVILLWRDHGDAAESAAPVSSGTAVPSLAGPSESAAASADIPSSLMTGVVATTAPAEPSAPSTGTALVRPVQTGAPRATTTGAPFPPSTYSPPSRPSATASRPAPPPRATAAPSVARPVSKPPTAAGDPFGTPH